ncbi:MAG: tetratricopeptide repeat protein [Chitinophagaceae bacterium]
MKKWIQGMFLSLMITGAGCHGGEESVSTNDPKILEKQPFLTLTDSIDRFPKEENLFLRRGLLLSQNNAHSLATADYKKAWKLAPDENNALLLASSLFIEGKQDEVVKFLNDLVIRYPANQEFRRRLSEAYVQQGKTKEALEQYNNILKNDSLNFQAWYEKAAISADNKDTATAISCLEKAYSLQPLQLYGLALANLYAETKNSKTLAFCDELIARDSAAESGDAFFIRGIYFSNLNEPKKALEQFEACIRRDWKFTDAYIEKGIILFEEKNIDEALNTFMLASKVSNTNPDAYYWQGRCFESIGKLEAAGDAYKRAVMLDREFTEARKALERLHKSKN